MGACRTNSGLLLLQEHKGTADASCVWIVRSMHRHRLMEGVSTCAYILLEIAVKLFSRFIQDMFLFSVSLTSLLRKRTLSITASHLVYKILSTLLTVYIAGKYQYVTCLV